MKKNKSLVKFNITNYCHYNKLHNIIPLHDIDSTLIITHIINKDELICANPNCKQLIKNKTYCIFDSFCCKNECKYYVKKKLELYWDKI